VSHPEPTNDYEHRLVENVVWPARDGRYPWEHGMDADVVRAQPVLGRPPDDGVPAR